MSDRAEKLSCGTCSREIRRRVVEGAPGKPEVVRYTVIERARGRDISGQVVVECPGCGTTLNDQTVVSPS